MPQTNDRATLCISRKDNEAVWIGNSRVEVYHDNRGRVRLVIPADKSVRIAREELLDRKPE